MQLFVLGPAFGLPSIDAHCLAAVALFKEYTKAHSEEWSIITTHEQFPRLPYLKTKDNKIISGFHNIARHLQSPANSPLSPEQTADATAVASFLESHAQPLLDISLYVAFENYTTTRSAFTKILPWHANYTLPPTLRSAARTRTAHLGISSLDVDDDGHEDLSNNPSRTGEGSRVGEPGTFEAETQKRASKLLGPGRRSVRGMLMQREHAAVFKLHALTENFLGPLEEMLGGSAFFLGRFEAPTEVDFLVFGFLALMLSPALPQDWLAKTLRRKYARLVVFTEGMRALLGLDTDVDDVMALAGCRGQDEVVAMRQSRGMNLPWDKPASSSPLEVVKGIAQDLIARIPMLDNSPILIPAKPTAQSAWRRNLPIIIGTTAASLGLLGYYAFDSGLLIWPHGEEIHVFGKRRFADYGHLGAALAGVSLLSQQVGQGPAHHEQMKVENPVHVDVEIEKGG